MKPTRCDEALGERALLERIISDENLVRRIFATKEPEEVFSPKVMNELNTDSQMIVFAQDTIGATAREGKAIAREDEAHTLYGKTGKNYSPIKRTL